MNFPSPAPSSTLSGASIGTAEGNKFNNVGGNQLKVTQHINFEFNVFSSLATFLDAIFNRPSQHPLAASESTADCSGNIQPQVIVAAKDSGSSVSLPIANITDIAPNGDDFSSSAVLDALSCTISPLSPPASIPQKYTVSMLECASGYPLYDPRPEGGPSTEYGKNGVRVGDVGIVTEDGVFDFLFNVCPSQNPSINPFELPEDFEVLENPEISVVPEHFSHDTHLFSRKVNREEEPRPSYKCFGPEGAILELPSGATRFEAKNKLSFKTLAARHAEEWYKYTVITRGREIRNGALYLITSSIKCTHWGIAVFHRPSSPQDYLQFIHDIPLTGDNQRSHPSFRWNGSEAPHRRVSPKPDPGAAAPNQCVFLRGYKIMLREDLWDNVTYIATTVGQSSSYPPNSRGSSSGQSPFSARGDGSQQGNGGSGGPDNRTTKFTTNYRRRLDNDESAIRTNPFRHQRTPLRVLGAWPGSERVLLETASDVPSLPHPSDLFNAVLLKQEPAAKVAITHDDDWCGLLRNFVTGSSVEDLDGLEDIVKSYRSTVDEHGCTFLKRTPVNPPEQPRFRKFNRHIGPRRDTSGTWSRTHRPTGDAERIASCSDSSPAALLPSSIDGASSTQNWRMPSERRSRGYISRPRTAFMLFHADFVMRKHKPGSIETNRSLSKIIGDCWDALPLDEKRIWEVRARQAIAEHKARVPNYIYVHNKSKGKKDKQMAIHNERRVIAQPLLEGKKGEEVADAIRDLDGMRSQTPPAQQPCAVRRPRRSSSVPLPNDYFSYFPNVALPSLTTATSRPGSPVSISQRSLLAPRRPSSAGPTMMEMSLTPTFNTITIPSQLGWVNLRPLGKTFVTPMQILPPGTSTGMHHQMQQMMLELDYRHDIDIPLPDLDKSLFNYPWSSSGASNNFMPSSTGRSHLRDPIPVSSYRHHDSLGKTFIPPVELMPPSASAGGSDSVHAAETLDMSWMQMGLESLDSGPQPDTLDSSISTLSLVNSSLDREDNKFAVFHQQQQKQQK